MKKLLFIASMMLFSSLSSFARTIHIDISFDLARPRFGCQHGFWICNPKAGVTVNDNRATGTFIDITDGNITLQLTSALAGTPDAFFAEKGEEVVLPDGVARQLGYGRVTIIPGRYTVDYSQGKFGQVVMTVETE